MTLSIFLSILFVNRKASKHVVFDSDESDGDAPSPPPSCHLNPDSQSASRLHSNPIPPEVDLQSPQPPLPCQDVASPLHISTISSANMDSPASRPTPASTLPSQGSGSNPAVPPQRTNQMPSAASSNVSGGSSPADSPIRTNQRPAPASTPVRPQNTTLSNGSGGSSLFATPRRTNQRPAPSSTHSSPQGSDRVFMEKVLSLLEHVKETQRLHGGMLRTLLKKSTGNPGPEEMELPDGISFPLESVDGLTSTDERLAEADFRKGLVSKFAGFILIPNPSICSADAVPQPGISHEYSPPPSPQKYTTHFVQEINW